jgi:pimeloyl-ACP methyl ester carboxylesterase
VEHSVHPSKQGTICGQPPPWRRRGARTGLLAALVAVTALLTTACATPVGVKLVDGRAVHRSLTASALSADEPSVYTKRTLQREGLIETFKDDPPAAIAKLHAGYVEFHRVDSLIQEIALFALAEMAFLHAEASGDRSYFLASAAYAYAFLFPDDQSLGQIMGWGYTPFDPRVRIAADLYNRALAEGLVSPEAPPEAESRPREVLLTPGRYALPVGELEIEVDPAGFKWAGYKLDHFVPSANLEVRGLRNRYRQPGLGVPLAASLSDSGDDALVGRLTDARIPPRLKIPVSALLRLDGARRGVAEGRLRGTLSVYTSDETAAVTIAGREVPLEYEPTAALAYTLEGSPVWEFELAGFFSGSFGRGARDVGRRVVPSLLRARPEDGVIFMAPHRPGKIPVVLVHGTASSPARWAELVNELRIDPRIAKHYQFWLFMYNTGNPIAYSGMLLREGLLHTVQQLDPEGKDPALRQMVVIGHSQGGLLTKLTVVNSGSKFWDNFSKVPIEELDIKPETRDLLRRSMFVEPVPHIRRVIFVATPHRGTPLSATGIVKWLTRFITLPLNIAGAATDILTLNKDRLVARSLDRLPSAVDNMSPSHPFIKTLSSLPIADGVTAHSIIAVKGDGPPEEGSDGVVPYWSAHVEPVASEKVVKSPHSVQSNPHAIEEIRRILIEHAGER